MPNNPVMAARFAYLTTRQDNRLAPQQARTACAAALLRWIYVVITRRVLGSCHRRREHAGSAGRMSAATQH